MNAEGEWLAILFRIRKVPDSNLDAGNGYANRALSCELSGSHCGENYDDDSLLEYSDVQNC
jgi:hypothetical protein